MENFFDEECSFLQQRVTTDFDSCVIEYNSEASDRDPSFENYRYGICQSSSKSSSTDDDEVTLSQASFNGAVGGSAAAGLIAGIIITTIVMIFCCSCRPGGENNDLADKDINVSQEEKTS